MARILNEPSGIGVRMDEGQARQALIAAGVQLLVALDSEGAVDPAVLELVLPPQARFVREVMTVDPPAIGERDSDMGCWHINSVDEVHSVLDGEGIMEFVTAQGVVSVLVEGGDVLVIQQAEHRYLPLSQQRWAVRWAGDPSTELISTQTGRTAQPWPIG